jgi:phosphatidylglycerophosphate synthase/putative flippase GtrA
VSDWYELVVSWIVGDLSPRGRVLTALGPAILVAAYFLIGLLVFSVRCAVKGVTVDAETEKRGRSLLVGFTLRYYFFWLMRPLGRAVVRSGVPANAITTLAALFGLGAGVAVAAGRFALGGWLFLFSGILDTLDGRVARARGEVTAAGSALDSVLDRYTDAAILVGLGWYYRDSWVLLAVLLALVGGSLVPYVRAKGESLGIPLRGGVMQRLERVLFLGIPTAMSPVLEVFLDPADPHPRHWLAIGGVVVVAVLANVSAIQRLLDLLRALRPEPPRPARRPLAHQVFWNAVAAAVATGADYAAVLAMVGWGGLPPAWATALGCGLGGGINFALNRVITFRSRSAVAPQAARYTVVSASSALLNAGGVALLGLHPVVDFALAWWVVRGAVWLGWNFPLQRAYVFAGTKAAEG